MQGLMQDFPLIIPKLLTHAEDRFLFVEKMFLPRVEAGWDKLSNVEQVFVLWEIDDLPESSIPTYCPVSNSCTRKDKE